MESTKATTTWPELAIGLYEQLTKRGAEITYAFDQLTVAVPAGAGAGEDLNAKWHVDGTLRISTSDRQSV
ncbi:MAG: hypothetical protein VXW00_03770 [Candidatus Latescibacterota bacterium]|nr:hypothetical protein [Candidatus Latescibacterota bacterium]|tara:strand:- start:269 stop:478 length:210 start_codon:yes stop_codon:yes gene_type:complete